MALALGRLQAETRKYAEEAIKLTAEALKLGRDWWLPPFVVVTTTIGALGAVPPAYNAFHH
jgi:hypothetical protein